MIGINSLVLIINVASIYCAAISNKLCWYINCITYSALSYILFKNGFLESMIPTVCIAVISLIGCFVWERNKQFKSQVYFNESYFFIGFAIIAALGSLLFAINNGVLAHPFSYGLYVSSYIVAIYLLAKREILTWVFLLTSNLLYAAIFGAIERNYFELCICFVSIIVSLYGLKKWLILYHIQHENLIK